MFKNKAEWHNRLSIFWLKKYGDLDENANRPSSITWTHGISGKQSSIGYTVVKDSHWHIPQEKPYLKLRYGYTEAGKTENVEYRVELTTTPCNYGGIRYWFVCPLIRNGQPCGQRVGVLYDLGKYFGCRKCGDIFYDSQDRSSKMFRGTSAVSLPDIEKLQDEITVFYYNGKPTRKYKRLIKMREKFEVKMGRIKDWTNRLKRANMV